jgi:hypothetical protein
MVVQLICSGDLSLLQLECHLSTQVLQKWRPCEHHYATFPRTISEFIFQVSDCWRAIPLGFGVCASRDAEASELYCW